MTNTTEVLKADVMALAVKSSEAALKAEGLGMMHRPLKIEDRVMADAQYRLAQDIAIHAREAYDAALHAWLLAGQPE